ncbi:MAG: class I tRNA ligase family protein [Micromonosporaceae bacterium]|nr:class I tRNA ligase family protein [Micromonosporaceae bacterium]
MIRAARPPVTWLVALNNVLAAVAWPYANGPPHIGHVSGFGVSSDVSAGTCEWPVTTWSWSPVRTSTARRSRCMRTRRA